jgi:hypothetical protein
MKLTARAKHAFQTTHCVSKTETYEEREKKRMQIAV